MIKAKEYLEEIKSWGIRYEAENCRIKLSGGYEKAREHYEKILKDDAELEAHLILMASNDDEELKCQIKERASIRYAEGLSGNLLSAVKSFIG